MRRIYYLDLIRVFLTMLVFYHHSAIAFGASGGWYYVSGEATSGLTQGLLSASMAVDQSYFMSLFFFISAYFLPASFDRKGIRGFFWDRLNRLGIPLLLFYFVLDSLLVYWIWGVWGDPAFGPMWFVFTLLVFESAYVAYRHFCGRRSAIKCEGFTWVEAVVFILLMGITAFLIRLRIPVGTSVLGLQLGYYPLYVAMYFLGIVAYRNQWLERLRMREAYCWLAIVLLWGIPSLLYMVATNVDRMGDFSGGWNRNALFYAMWEPVMCVGLCYSLLALGKNYFNVPSPFIRSLSLNSYSFYIIHPFVVVGCIFAAEIFPVPPLVRLALVCIIGIPLCFIVAIGFRKLLGSVHVRI